MRRAEKEIRHPAELEDVLRRGTICRLGLCSDSVPYVVPMNYGYSDGSIYLHCATSGRKIEMVRRNDRVCFEVEVDTELVRNNSACGWGMRFTSIIGYGRLEELHGPVEKRRGLGVLMEHISGRGAWEIPEDGLADVLVLRLRIETMTCKRSGD